MKFINVGRDFSKRSSGIRGKSKTNDEAEMLGFKCQWMNEAYVIIPNGLVLCQSI